MACPTCDHTMHNIGTNRSHLIYWCPRCGTIKDGNPYRTDPTRIPLIPRLVGRCWDFKTTLAGSLEFAGNKEIDRLWQSLGIAESINTPENRKEPTMITCWNCGGSGCSCCRFTGATGSGNSFRDNPDRDDARDDPRPEPEGDEDKPDLEELSQ